MTDLSVLHDKRIAITSSKRTNDMWFQRCLQLGMRATQLPLIHIQSSITDAIIQRLQTHLKQADWVVFTSLNELIFFFEAIQPSTLSDNIQFACVGKKTAAALAEHGLQANFVSSTFTSDHLARTLPIKQNTTVLAPRGNQANVHFVDLLTERGANVIAEVIYTTEHNPLTPAQKHHLAEQDAIALTSPSAVSSFCEQLDNFKDIAQSSTIACIGPATARRGKQLALTIDVMPEQYYFDALLNSLAQYWA